MGSTLAPTAFRAPDISSSCDISFAEARSMIAKNVLSCQDSSRLLTRVDNNFIVATKTAWGPRTFTTKAWIEDYMISECDKDPMEVKYYSPEVVKGSVYYAYK